MAITINWDSTSGKDTLKTLIRKTYNTTDREPLVEHKDLYNVISTEDEFERDLRFAGLGRATELTDGEEIPTQDPPDPSTKTYTQGYWGNGFRITAGMKMYNKIGLMKAMTKDLKRTMIESKDIDAMTLWNNLTSTSYLGFDELALASNSHTTLDDAATGYDNYLDAALGVTSYRSGKVYFRTLVDDQGMTFVAKPDTLVVNPELEQEADELLGSTLKPWTGDNTTNVYKGDTKPLVCSRITSATMWAMLAKNHALYDVNILTSQAPNLIVKDAPDNSEDTVVLSSQRYTWGFGDPRCCFIGDL